MRTEFIKKIGVLVATAVLCTSVGTQVVAAEELTGNILQTEIVSDAEGIVYAEDVVTDLGADYTADVTAEGTTEVVTEDETVALELQQGDILILPAQSKSESQQAIEVQSVTETDAGYVITGEEPTDFFDIVEAVDLDGTAEATVKDIVLADGVTTEVAAEDTNQKGRSWFAIVSTGNVSANTLQLHVDKQLDANNYIAGDLTLTPSLDYRLLFDLKGVQELSLIVNNNLTISNAKIACNQSGSLPIATIPYTFGNGMFTVYVNLNLVYTAEGSAYLSYSMNGYYGMTYNGSTSDFLSGYEITDFSYGLEAVGKVGMQLQMGLVALTSYSLMDAELNAGVAAELSAGQAGGNATVYFYLDGKYGYGSILSKYGVCGTKVIYSRENSPFKYHLN